jgi:hypothetical protein
VCWGIRRGGGVALHARFAAAPTNKSTVGLNNELNSWSLTFSSESDSHFCAKEIGSAFIESDKRGRDDVAPRFELSICRNSRLFTFLLSWDDVVDIATRLRVGRSGV